MQGQGKTLGNLLVFWHSSTAKISHLPFSQARQEEVQIWMHVACCIRDCVPGSLMGMTMTCRARSRQLVLGNPRRLLHLAWMSISRLKLYDMGMGKMSDVDWQEPERMDGKQLLACWESGAWTSTKGSMTMNSTCPRNSASMIPWDTLGRSLVPWVNKIRNIRIYQNLLTSVWWAQQERDHPLVSDICNCKQDDGSAMFKEQTSMVLICHVPGSCSLLLHMSMCVGFDLSLFKPHSWQSRWLCQKSPLMDLQHAPIMLSNFVTFRAPSCLFGKTNASPIFLSCKSPTHRNNINS